MNTLKLHGLHTAYQEQGLEVMVCQKVHLDDFSFPDADEQPTKALLGRHSTIIRIEKIV